MKSYSFVHFLVVLIVCVRDCISLQNNTVAKSCNLLKELFLHEPQKVLYVTYYRAFSVHLVFITYFSVLYFEQIHMCYTPRAPDMESKTDNLLQHIP